MNLNQKIEKLLEKNEKIYSNSTKYNWITITSMLLSSFSFGFSLSTLLNVLIG